MADFKGDVQSKLEKRMLNQRVRNEDLVMASMNPLVQALSGTDTQMKFSKPVYHTVYDPKGKVDVELSHDIAENLEDIDFFGWAQVADSDGFRGGRGVSELAWRKDDSGYINYYAMERRPYDTFIRPKNSKIVSTALRWKGMYLQDGVLHFDQTQTNVSGNKTGAIVSLDPKQIFSLSPLGSRFIDESILEYLLPYLDAAAYAFDLVYVVMTEQINPKELQEIEEGAEDDAIAQKIIEGQNSIEQVKIPSNMALQHPRFYNRDDILKFYNFATREMYKIVFPISALSDGGEGKTALLDNSSATAKMSTFFAYIQSGRLRICREVNKIGNNWLDMNGFKKKGYRYELIPAPIEPKDVQNELKIMLAARKNNDISQKEFRNWVNSTVIGIRLEEDYEAENADKLGQKVQPKVDKNVSNVIDKVKEGEDPVEAMADLVT